MAGDIPREIGALDKMIREYRIEGTEDLHRLTELLRTYFMDASETADLAEYEIRSALQHYDRVVVDSAPVTAVSDTLTIARSCQTTVLVIRSHKTPRKPILRTVQLLRKSGANVCGVVLNLQPRHWRPAGYQRDYLGYSRNGSP